MYTQDRLRRLSLWLRATLSIFVLCVSVTVVTAQEYKWEVGGEVGSASCLGDANRTNPFNPLGLSVGGVVRYNYHFRAAFTGKLAYAMLPISSRGVANAMPNRQEAEGRTHLGWLCMGAEYNFRHYSDKFRYLNTYRFTPFVAGGIDLGVAVGRKVAFAPGLTAGIGVKYKLFNRVNLVAFLSGSHLFSDALDAPTEALQHLNNPYGVNRGFLKGGDGVVGLTLSVTYEFGSNKEVCNIDE